MRAFVLPSRLIHTHIAWQHISDATQHAGLVGVKSNVTAASAVQLLGSTFVGEYIGATLEVDLTVALDCGARTAKSPSALLADVRR